MSYLKREQEKIDADFASIRAALDLGLQAWRTTDSRQRFLDAFDALSRIAYGIGAGADSQSVSPVAPDGPDRLRERVRGLEDALRRLRALWKQDLYDRGFTYEEADEWIDYQVDRAALGGSGEKAESRPEGRPS